MLKEYEKRIKADYVDNTTTARKKKQKKKKNSSAAVNAYGAPSKEETALRVSESTKLKRAASPAVRIASPPGGDGLVLAGEESVAVGPSMEEDVVFH